jgi:pimeloyl-ACP methyl ester carboxylesterase
MEYVTSRDGTRIAYQRSGSGPVVVLVASALADRRDAKRLARRLSERFTVVNYDRRGRGASGDTSPYEVACEVADSDALIDDAGGSASIFSSSSGAVLALEAANALGEKVTRLALFEPPFITDDSRAPLSTDDVLEIEQHLAAGRRGDAVKEFMTRRLGMPTAMVAAMRLLPTWSKLKKLAHTLPYDLELMKDTQSGAPLPADRWTSVAALTLVLTGKRATRSCTPPAERSLMSCPPPGAPHSAAPTMPPSSPRRRSSPPY